MIPCQFRGVFPDLVSPIGPYGAVPEGELRRPAEHLIAAGVHGLTPLVSVGELTRPDAALRRGIVEVVVEQARGRVPVVAGVAATQAQDHAAMGADGILAILEAYLPVPEARRHAMAKALAPAERAL